MIPISTTTIAVLRIPAAASYDEPYSGAGQPTRIPVITGVRAVIDRVTGTSNIEGGQQNVTLYQLTCDPCDLIYLDLILDELSGRTFRIRWLMHYPQHVEAGIRDIDGET